MSRYITKYINLEKLKQPIFWNGGSTSIEALFFREKKKTLLSGLGLLVQYIMQSLKDFGTSLQETTRHLVLV